MLTLMVDWQGLFKLSMKLYDEKMPDLIKPMTSIDKSWIETQLSKPASSCPMQLKSAVQEMSSLSQMACAKLKTTSKHVAGESSPDEIIELFEDLLELVEQNSQNSISFCRLGGMKSLLELIVTHDSDQVRQIACHVFSSCCDSNPEV